MARSHRSRVAEWADLLGASVPETACRDAERDDATVRTWEDARDEA